MVVLICISLMNTDVEHFFTCFSAILYSSVGNSLSVCPHFLIGLIDSLESSVLSSSYILDISRLSDVGMVKGSTVASSFVLLTVSLALTIFAIEVPFVDT